MAEILSKWAIIFLSTDFSALANAMLVLILNAFI